MTNATVTQLHPAYGDSLRVVRDQAPNPYINCPECSHRIEIPGLDGTEWSVRSPGDIGDNLVLRMHGLTQEELIVVTFDVKLHVLTVESVYKGSVDQCLVRISELFRTAIKLNGAAILTAHDHPSGDPTPSPQDLALAADTIAAGKLLGIRVIDSLVIGGNRWVSIRDRGVAFPM